MSNSSHGHFIVIALYSAKALHPVNRISNYTKRNGKGVK